MEQKSKEKVYFEEEDIKKIPIVKNDGLVLNNFIKIIEELEIIGPESENNEELFLSINNLIDRKNNIKEMLRKNEGNVKKMCSKMTKIVKKMLKIE